MVQQNNGAGTPEHENFSSARPLKDKVLDDRPTRQGNIGSLRQLDEVLVQDDNLQSFLSRGSGSSVQGCVWTLFEGDIEMAVLECAIDTIQKMIVTLYIETAVVPSDIQTRFDQLELQLNKILFSLSEIHVSANGLW